MRILSLTRSFLHCTFARSLALVQQSGREYFVVASNYGSVPDPNAVAMISYLVEAKRKVIYVGDAAYVNDRVMFAKRGSLHSTRIFLGARAVFYTHSLSDVLPVGHKLWLFKSVFGFPTAVFLQHGVIGLKRTLSSGVSMASYVKSLEPTFDFMVVSSKAEQALVEQMGVANQKLAITGLPRFDVYVNHRERNRTKVLLFFTWQEVAQLEKKVRTVSSALESLQIDREYKICIGSHQMQGASSAFTDDSKALTQVNTRELQSVVTDCALLITDDSSIAWDILFLGGEVLFYQPAENWLTSSSELYSRVSRTPAEFAEQLRSWQSRELPPTLPFAEYYDDSNAARVLDLVEKGS